MHGWRAAIPGGDAPEILTAGTVVLGTEPATGGSVCTLAGVYDERPSP